MCKNYHIYFLDTLWGSKSGYSYIVCKLSATGVKVGQKKENIFRYFYGFFS